MKISLAKLKALTYIVQAKWVWKRPKKAKILIYDRAGADLFFHYLSPDDTEILDVRGESFNIPILLRSLFFNKGKYRELFIKLVEPRIVLTFIDNSIAFCSLKTPNTPYTTIFVQNGLRSETFDILRYFKNKVTKEPAYRVDYMFVFNECIGQEYSKYIQGKVIPIGSFKNNLISVTKKNREKTILFISQYRVPPQQADCFMQCEGHTVSWDIFYAAERAVLPFLAQYAKEHDYRLCITSALKEHENQEYQFYTAILAGYDWQFLSQKDTFSGYLNVDEADYVVFIDSALGYEALARKKRVAAFSIRNVYAPMISINFGWPANLPNKGPFWTNNVDETEFASIMDYITTIGEQEWETMLQPYLPRVMEYDAGNKKFLNLMQALSAHDNFLVC